LKTNLFVNQADCKRAKIKLKKHFAKKSIAMLRREFFTTNVCWS